MRLGSAGARRRLMLIALLGVGVPVLVLAAFGAYQTRHLGRYLSDTSSDYGAYAASLGAQTLSQELERRVSASAADIRLATLWGGASQRLLNLMNTGDPLLRDPCLVPDTEVIRAGETASATAEGKPAGTPLPPDTPVAARAFRSPDGALTGEVTAPARVWRAVLGTVYDTMYVVPIGPAQRPFVLVPLLGFQGRVVAVAGWRLDDAALDQRFFRGLFTVRVFGDPRVYRADRMAGALSLAVYDESGRERFRMGQPAGDFVYAESRVGPALPGWRVAVGPSAGSPYLWMRRFVVAAYLLMLFLVALCLAALLMALQQASAEIRLAEAKSAFLANVSHELKTPLALIRMAGETLQLGRVRNDEERLRFLQVINRECRRLTFMINHVLDFATIEAGKKEFHFHPTDLGRVVRETVEVFEPQFQAGQFEVRVDVPPDLPPVEADSEAVTRCLMNFIDNAVKYSKDSRFIEVRARVRPPGGDGDAGEARLAVADHGIGLTPHDRERIFDKFFRVEQGLVHDVKGSGLGLSLVRQIAEAHGGRVEVESSLGQGSTFTLVLPARQDRVSTGRS
jgi:signal transduction histidine kinase